MAVLSFADLSDAIISRTSGYRTDYRDTWKNLTSLEQVICNTLMLEAAETSGTNLALDGTLTVEGIATINADASITGELSVSQLIAAGGSIQSTSTTIPIGYGTGAGGAVTQGTSKSTTVALATPTGAVTMHNASLNDATNVAFTVTNANVAANDNIIVNHISGGTLGAYQVWGHSPVAATSFKISVRNVSGGALGEAIVLQYTLIRGKSS